MFHVQPLLSCRSVVRIVRSGLRCFEVQGDIGCFATVDPQDSGELFGIAAQVSLSFALQCAVTEACVLGWDVQVMG